MAEWLCSGLQLRVRRFDSDSSLHFSTTSLQTPEFSAVSGVRSAELRWCSGYTVRLARGHPVLQTPSPARVAKLVDARDLKSLDRKVVPVRPRPRAPRQSNTRLLVE